jgi:hypothetical protein
MAGLVSTSAAAERLHLSVRQVRNLAAAGHLTQVARGVLDATSVDRYDAVRRTGTQAWAPPTAWAAVALLAGHPAPWLDAPQTRRLRRRLPDLVPEHLVERARRRSAVSRYAAHRSALPRLAADLVVPRREIVGLSAGTGTAVDGYLGADDAERLVRDHALRLDVDGTVTLRATTMDLDVVRRLATTPVLAALDLAPSLDPREREVSLAVLHDALEGLRP